MAELGRRAGVSGAYIQQLESGTAGNPSMAVLQRIETALTAAVTDAAALVGQQLSAEPAKPQAHPGIEALLNSRGFIDTLQITPRDAELLRQVRLPAGQRIQTVQQAIQLLAVLRSLNE